MTFLNTLISSKLAAAAIAAGVLSVGGVGAAAYAGILPTELQTVANEIIGTTPSDDDAAEVTETETETETTETDDTAEGSDDATEESDDSTDPATRAEKGKSLFGLCNAFTKGGLSYNSTAFGSLVESIPTTETVEEVVVDGVITEVATTTTPTLAEFCATVGHPGKSDKSAKNGTDDSDSSEDSDSNTSAKKHGDTESNGKSGSHGKSESNGKSGSKDNSNSGKNGRP